VLVGYRYNITRWVAAEANYGYDRNTQSYIGSTSAGVQSKIYQLTGSAVVKLPGFARIQPYALAGGGGLILDPTDNAGGTFSGVTSQARGAFLYGGGADYAFTRHLSLRAEYRGFVYKAPSFSLASLNTDTWTDTAQPSSGIVFRFQPDLAPDRRMSSATGPRLVRAEVGRGTRQMMSAATSRRACTLQKTLSLPEQEKPVSKAPMTSTPPTRLQRPIRPQSACVGSSAAVSTSSEPSKTFLEDLSPGNCGLGPTRSATRASRKSP
jgi:outer membrane immunogenic protein